MFLRVLADLVLLIHLSFILFVVLGGLLALRWRWMPWAHVPAAAWGAAIELFAWLCPLTPLENWLRQASGSAGYSGSFVERYLIPVVYPAALTREIQILLGAGVLALNVAVYYVVWRRLHRRRPAA